MNYILNYNIIFIWCEMAELRTGPVRLSGYALKLRRVFNAAFKDKYKSGELDANVINEDVSELNRKIYEVLVDRFEIPKEAIVNITVDYDVTEDKHLKINDISIEVFDKDEILSKNATKEVKSKLGLEG